MSALIINMLVSITCRLASISSNRDPEVKSFLRSSSLSRKLTLQVLVKNTCGWSLNVSNPERAKIEVSLECFWDDPREYEIMNTVILYWPGLCPRVVVDCVTQMNFRWGMQSTSYLEICENHIFDDLVSRIPQEILVLDYTEIFFPNRWKGVPPNAFRRIRSRFNCRQKHSVEFLNY